jgi:hypothetical protein
MLRPLTKTKATICVALNLLMLPGLGTLIAGRRSGWAQLILGLIGFGLNFGWAVWFFAVLLRSEQLPENLTAHIWVALSGVAIFLIGWLWALVSSLQISREARAYEQRQEIERADQ